MRSFAMKAAVVGIAALWLGGCETGPEVRADYDKAADFGKYRTYNFVAATGTGSTDAKSLAQQILQNAASREMESRGYTKADNADLLINFKGKLEEKTDIESTPAPMYGAGWGYRGYYGAPYGAYGYGGTEVSTRRYNVGTLVMDMVDRTKQQVVFQGGVEDVVTKKMLEDREALLTGAVSTIFAKFPFRAGQSAPVPTPAAQ
ncbi:MAG TPA: DUF4136 domain-containing protein [Methylomirabilota bacterium]|nr:DUF4136 domain-containing protein [Methylomirabilota bacterium]